VVGICVFPDFVGPTVKDVIDHVDHVVNLTSVEHVGFGLDLNTHGDMTMFKTLQFKSQFYSKPPWKFPQGIERLSKWPNLTKELVSRGYSEVDIEKILGGNFLRVLNEVWKE
jgi:membrane dipeptidase